MTLKTTIKNLIKKYDLRINKLMGHNFLINPRVLQKIIETADLKNDIVLEVGPGLGTLTQELAKKAKKVIAVEKDKQMNEVLKETLKDFDNIEIVEGDILKILKQKPSILKNSKYKVVANIPYYLTSPLIRMLLESDNPPEEIVLMIQKEVAQRITAQPPKMNLLAISVQFYAQPKTISYISKASFWPEPKVDSAIIRITPHPSVILRAKPEESHQRFFKIVKAGFSSPRKQLANNLSEKLKIDKEKIKTALAECELNPQARAESLNVEDWKKLSSDLIFQDQN
ncbi:ribosomal RNA small subunit methyltransferase A [Patescibacteria group bacterium]|nr:ribosomal RNA small subunit methyltransferase A [Patescibacteria group bacterium]